LERTLQATPEHYSISTFWSRILLYIQKSHLPSIEFAAISKFFKSYTVNLKIGAAVGGLPLLFETSGRQAEIALFTMYNNFKTLYNEARRRNIRVRIPAGNCFITAFALCILCYHYFNDKSSIKRNYVTLMDKLLSEEND
jgi:hypothetical protein